MLFIVLSWRCVVGIYFSINVFSSNRLNASIPSFFFSELHISIDYNLSCYRVVKQVCLGLITVAKEDALLGLVIKFLSQLVRDVRISYVAEYPDVRYI